MTGSLPECERNGYNTGVARLVKVVDSVTLCGMATDNYCRSLDRIAAVQVLRDHLDELHDDDRPRPQQIAKASKAIGDSLALANTYALLAVADEIDALRRALAP